MKLSILIPVFNEYSTISTVLDRVIQAPIPPDIDREIIVLDDGSTDATWASLKPFLNHPCVQCRRFSTNRGKGHVLREGLLIASGDWILIQDADLEYDPRDYSKLLEPLQNHAADIVYGSRFMGADLKITGYVHFWGNGFVTQLANLFFKTRLTDMETAYKAFTKDAARRLRWSAERFGFEVEFTSEASRLGLRITEVPVRYTPRKKSEGKKFGWYDRWDTLKTLWICFRRNREKLS